MVAANCMKARDLERVLLPIVDEIQNKTSHKCLVELRDPVVAKVFAMSKRAASEFPENYPEELLLAISLGRFALDPAIETAQLFNTDDDCLCIQLRWVY